MRLRDEPSIKALHQWMVVFGYVCAVLYVLALIDLIDVHIYIGPDAAEWHRKHSSEER